MRIGRQLLFLSLVDNRLVDFRRHMSFRMIPIVNPEFDRVYFLGCFLLDKLARLLRSGSLVNYLGREWRPTIHLTAVVRDNSVVSSQKQSHRGVVQLSRALVPSNLKFDVIMVRAQTLDRTDAVVAVAPQFVNDAFAAVVVPANVAAKQALAVFYVRI